MSSEELLIHTLNKAEDALKTIKTPLTDKARLAALGVYNAAEKAITKASPPSTERLCIPGCCSGACADGCGENSF